MLGKLIKYEFKATGKLFLLFYAGLIFMAVLSMIIMPWGRTGGLNALTDMFDSSTATLFGGVLQSLLFIMYIILAIAVAIVTFTVIIMRFYKMLGDEGYLMFTLPVKTSSHILSKLIVSTIWYICTGLVILVSIFIVVGRFDIFAKIIEGFRDLSDYGVHPWLWVISIACIFIIGVIANTLQFYLAIAIGPHITKSRIGGTIIGYIMVYAATQIISAISVIPMVAVIRNFGELFSSPNPDIVEVEATLLTTTNLYFIILLLVCAIPSYFLTQHLIKNKLNLG